MTGPSTRLSYGALLRLPGVVPTFAAASLGRLSYATISLSMLVTVEQAANSYAVAGTSLGAFAIASTVMPIKSRWIDLHGRRFVLPPLCVLLASTLLAVVICSARNNTDASTYIVCCAVAGLVAPPLGPSMRALWASLTPDPADRYRAYSLDGIAEEVIYAVGPLIVGLILITGAGADALLITGVLNLIGTLGMAFAPVAATSPERAIVMASPGVLGPLARPGFALLALLMIGVGVGSGPLEVAVLARSQTVGQAQVAGYLLAAFSVGSVAGGLAWGHVRHSRRTARQLGALVAITAVGTGAAAIAPTLAVMAFALVIVGLASAPTLIVAYVTADDLVQSSARTEAGTWVTTSTNGGIALGAAAAGIIISSKGPTAALLTAAMALVLTAFLVFIIRHRLEPRDPTPAAVLSPNE